MGFLNYIKKTNVGGQINESYLMFAELSKTEQIDLLVEQLTIERQCCLREITDLRNLLDEKASNTVESWLERSDKELDYLLHNRLGECGRLVELKRLITPYSWRRKVRKRF
jgi:DNA-directed RNA polymerase subunit N (RpoN/RPB10)